VKPRLLFISPRFLFPMDQGGKIRTANTLRGLKGGAFEIVLAAPVPPDWQRHETEVAALCDRFVHWPEPHAGLAAKVLALAGTLPVPVATDRSAAGKAVIAQEYAAQPDVVVVDFPHAMVLLPPGDIPGTSVMFTHNVEAEIFDRHAEVARFPMRLIWQDQARKMRRFEGETLRRFDAVIAVSARDARALETQFALPRVDAIDTGVDLDFYPYTQPHPAADQGGRLVFSGAMDSRSNIDGVTWLAESIWPLIAARRPKAEMIVVGRNPNEALVARVKTLGLPFTFTGFVDDIRPHVAGADISVIPLRVGSGTRIKAFEAMALGRPVVSTQIGTEGLDITPGEHFLEADTPEAFANAAVSLLENPTRAVAMAAAARARLEERFSWRHVARQFEAICLTARQRRCGK
jgi:glycosyltransferase involved in cell wall biosynthesis